MSARRTSILAALLCLAPPATLLAQYTAARIVFKNPGPYAPADLEATSGLHIGKPFTKEDLGAAAQKLIATGLFDDVQVVLDGPVKTISVNFTLKPYDPAQLLQASFENFLWWQPDELLAQLHARVPLLSATAPALPEAGDEQDAVTSALDAMLTAKGITAHVERRVLEPSLTQPRRAVVYTVSFPDFRLHSFTFTGVSPSQAPVVGELLPRLIGRPYLDGTSPGSSTERVLNLYRNAGYLEVSFTTIHRSLSTTSPSRIDVDLTGVLHEGEVFHVAGVDWAGSPLMSTATFNTGAKLHASDVASRYQLLQTLLPLDRAYRSHGYLDAIIDAKPVLDPAAHRVAYTVTVDPGEPYHLKTFTADNLTPAQTADFNSAWKLKPQDIYDAEYVNTFLTGNGGLTSLRGYSASDTITADPATHLVDLTLTFVKGGNLVGQ